MKLRTQLSVLHPETVVRLWDVDKLDLVVKVENIQNELKGRTVKSLRISWLDSEYDLYIELKV